MALQPLVRPAGSSYRLRYRGLITQGEAFAVFPKTNATYPSDAPIIGSNFLAYVRFALFDATSSTSPATNTAKRLLPFVYDDEQPSALAPHAPQLVTAGGSPGTELVITSRTWAQNVQIHYNKIDTNVVLADAAIAIDNDILNGAQVMIDTTSAGLGTNTGLPVVIIAFTVATADGGARRDFSVDLTFEVTQSSTR